MTYIQWVVFIETPIFFRRIQQYMEDDEYTELQIFLATQPDAGKIIKGAGGMRKLRWAGSGRGKRGGLRVIYYWWVAKDRISLLLVYPKNEMDDLTAEQVKILKNQLTP
jgi:mRNA-degrading endonuclease RelE of RelBE toxin-antitoxin system